MKLSDNRLNRSRGTDAGAFDQLRLELHRGGTAAGEHPVAEQLHRLFPLLAERLGKGGEFRLFRAAPGVVVERKQRNLLRNPEPQLLRRFEKPPGLDGRRS